MRSYRSSSRGLGYAPLRIAGLYAAFGFLWIWLSDSALIWFGVHDDQWFLAGAMKGTGYVAVTAVLLWWLVRREVVAVQSSENLLRAVVDGTTDAVFVKDLNGRYLLVNKATAGFVGRPAEDIIGRDDRELFATEDANRIIANDRATMAGGKVVTWEETLTSAGVISFYLAKKGPFRDSFGAITGVIGVSRDITDRNEIEAELRETESRLREAQRIARMGSWDWEPKTGRVSWSDAEYELFGMDRMSVTPSFEAFLALLHPDDRPTALARVESIRAGADEFANDMRVIRPDGTVMWIHSRARVTRDDSGTPFRLEGTDQDITARRLADEALRASEERIQEAVRVAGIGVFEHDHLAEELFWSARLREIYGITPDFSVNLRAFLSMIHSDDVEDISAAVRQAHDPAGDGRFDVEHRIVRPADGRVRWIATQSKTRFVDNGLGLRPARTVGATVDVTAAREAAEALRESEDRYRRLMAVLPTAVLVHDGERVMYCNPAFVSLIGASSAEEVLTRRLTDCVSEEYQQLAHDRPAETIAADDPVVGTEIRLTRIDGRTVPTYSVTAPVTGYGSQAFLIALSDLTERERATQLLRSVLSNVNDAILTMDELGIIRSANPAAFRHFGWNDEELIGSNITLLMPEIDQEEQDSDLANDRLTEGAKLTGVGREVECVRKDKTHFTAELTVTEFLLDGEKHFTGVLRDITERQRLQSQFIQAQKMEAVGRLAGGVAHDFNNLLTIISGYCDLLLIEDHTVVTDVRESLETIRDAAGRAARLTQQLLAFSRKAIIEPRLIDLNVLVTDSVRLLRRLIGEDIILDVVTASRPIQVKADPGQIEQVIMNLVVNARDAMPTGGRLRLETSTCSAAEGDSSPFARLSVSDTGHGMPAEVKSKIFEPFFTTKDVGKGTGLGLAVVHGVVSQNGGRIAVESAVGVGTTFHIQLPLMTDPSSAPDADSTRQAVGGSETILLVEDDEAVRRIARLSLQSQGYQVLEADGGKAAIQIVQTHPGEIHLLVSDVVMPEMGGRQLLDAVRQHRPALRVLFMSGYTDDAMLHHGIVDAADSFIQKPFTPLSLARKVRDALHGAK